MGVEMIEEKIRTLPEFPPELAVLLKHLLLSHHGQYEYGSPKRPKTLEAVILNFLDDLDAKINGVRTHIEKEPDNPAPGPATTASMTAISSRIPGLCTAPGRRRTHRHPGFPTGRGSGSEGS